MSSKGKIKKSIKIIGSAKNYLDHRKFKKNIDRLGEFSYSLSREISFSRMNINNLNQKLNIFYKQFRGLYKYSKINVKKLFKIYNKHTKRINELDKKIAILEKEIKKLKTKK